MKKSIVIAFIILLALYILLLSVNIQTSKVENPHYKHYVYSYKETIKKYSVNNNANSNISYLSDEDGLISNFEGPEVRLKAIKFHDQMITQKNLGDELKYFDGISAHFDPDHPYFGLPDVMISIQDVRLYNPHRSSAAKLLKLKEQNPEPYKTYTKEIFNDSTGQKSIFTMQLWLTEFNVTIDVRPDRDIPVNITSDEMESTSYPGYWYGSQQKAVKLKELDREHKDFRYGDLTFILEINPDNVPVYVNVDGEKTEKADFAVAAIYCQEAKFGNEPDVQRISSNVHAGKPLFLNTSIQGNPNAETFNADLSEQINIFMSPKIQNESTIWNRPYYASLFFNNLGTWRSGVFNQNQFHDQVSYSFLMPIFVIGSWDVISPQEVLPEWNPPEPYVRKFSLTSLLPFGGMGVLGKIGGFAMLALVVFLGVIMIFPGFLPLIARKFVR